MNSGRTRSVACATRRHVRLNFVNVKRGRRRGNDERMLFFQLYRRVYFGYRSLGLNKKICQSETGTVIIELNVDVISENLDEEKNR